MYGLVNKGIEEMVIEFHGQDKWEEIKRKAFWEYWILFTAEKGYGEMLNLAGSTLPDFLKNLDMLHGRVNNLMHGNYAH